MSGVNLRPKWDKIRDKPSDLVRESVAFSFLTLNDTGMVAEYRLTAQDGRIEYFPVLGGTTEQLAYVSDLSSYVQTSAMQAYAEPLLPSQTGNSGKYLTTNGTAKSWATIDLSTKQDAAAFLTTLVGIGGTSGSGNLARVTSPTFVTPVLGAASATSVSIAGTGNLTLGTNANIYFEGSQTQVYFNQSNGYGVAIRGTTTPRIYMLPAGCFAFSATTLDGSPSSTWSQQSAGVIQIGTTGNNALGSLACANVTASGTVTGGYLVSSNDVTAGYNIYAANAIYITSKGFFDATSNGNWRLRVNNGSTPGNLDLGNVTASGTVRIGGGATILKLLSATATLDFGSVAANSFADLTVTVTGAAVGDTVSIGVPNGSLLNDISFFGWVSATNTVTVRCSNVSSTTARDPASGTFRATVTQF